LADVCLQIATALWRHNLKSVHRSTKQMKTFGKVSIVALAAFSAITVSVAIATSGTADSSASILNDKNVAPYIKNASAVIYAPGLAQGTLFQLRGAVGSAWFTRKDVDGNWCDVSRMRLITGDFGGNTVGVSRSEPVVLIALNSAIASSLASGQDIVSGDFDLLDIDQAVVRGLDGVDILVAGSADVGNNYILNPGRSFLNDIFGASSTRNECKHDSAYSAIAAE
jgi:hypothetical protein